MKDSKLIVLIGISGSGKSTFASTTVRGNPERYLLVNRDKIRELLFGYNESTINEYYNRPDLNKLEKEVTKYEDTLIYEGICSGKDVIVDATHLKKNYIRRFKYWNKEVELKFFDVELEVAISRDKNRTRCVGSNVIEKQYKNYIKLKESLKNDPIDFTTYQFENIKGEKPSCVVLDIDGTVAHMQGMRSPYDWNKVDCDFVDNNIRFISNCIWGAENLVVCSGRDSVCTDKTIEWLETNDVKFDLLIMRTEKDNRPDWVVKEEMWSEISNLYYIEGLIDDRCQVVRRARMLGLKVLQVENNNF